MPTLAWYATAGAAAGIIAKWADEPGLTGAAGWAAGVLGWLTSLVTIWLLAIAVTAAGAPTAGAAAVRAATFFTSMTVAYYAYARLVLGFPLDQQVVVWTLLSWTLVPLLAAGIVLARTPSRPPLVAGPLAAPGVGWAWAESLSLIRRLQSGSAGSDQVAVAVFTVGLGVAIWWYAAPERRRVATLVASVPWAVAMGMVLESYATIFVWLVSHL